MKARGAGRRPAGATGAGYGYDDATLGGRVRSRATPIALTLLVLLFTAAIGVVLVTRQGPGAAPPAARSSLGPPPSTMPDLGALVQSRVQAGGDVRVTQWIQTYSPFSQLEVVPPQPRDGVDPEASDVRVVSGAGRASGPRSVTADAARYDLAAPAQLVRVTYTLSGVVDQRSTVRGRVLARLTALPLRYEGRAGPTVYSVSGGRGGTVLTVACEDPARTDEPPTPCGKPSSGSAASWEVRLDGSRRDAQVIAQLDLG